MGDIEKKNRITKIIEDTDYCRRMKHITESEYDRVFCRHGLGHALSVARIAFIIDLEERLSIEREIVYAAALLHDIGRYSELEESMSHHEAGAVIAEGILRKADFSEDEIRLISGAIRAHKKKTDAESQLADILYRADKLSRNCFLCDARTECYWNEDLKNKTIYR